MGQFIHRGQVRCREFAFCRCREVSQGVEIVVDQVSWLLVNNAKRSQSAAIGKSQWASGIETNIGFVCYQWVISKTFIFCCIVDDKYLVTENRMSAK